MQHNMEIQTLMTAASDAAFSPLPRLKPISYKASHIHPGALTQRSKSIYTWMALYNTCDFACTRWHVLWCTTAPASDCCAAKDLHMEGLKH